MANLTDLYIAMLERIIKTKVSILQIYSLETNSSIIMFRRINKVTREIYYELTVWDEDIKCYTNYNASVLTVISKIRKKNWLVLHYEYVDK